MAILRIDIERALDELVSQEEGMRFQGLAVVLGKMRWPELIASQRKSDLGLDAYASARLTPEKIGKGLSASITPTLGKISGDAETAKENFSDLKELLFVTSAKVSNAKKQEWKTEIYKKHGLELHIIGREDIILEMLMPANASVCATFLSLNIDVEPQITELINRTRRSADAVTRTWAGKTKGHPLIDLTAVRLDSDGAESNDVLSLEQIDQALSQSRRLVIEGPAGRGKTTTLIQLAQRIRTTGLPFIVELPAWISSRRGILEYIAGHPAFQAESLTAADLARVQQTEPFLLLLNGWNEIAESDSAQANDALRELERNFPSAGIIVATRAHHLTPPLPGALRLRLLRLNRTQRAYYLETRCAEKSAELRALIDFEPSLDELTRTPFILSAVASLFEANAKIPSTKMGVLAKILHVQEQREEHRNSLQSEPILGRQSDYLKALAIEMTNCGTVALQEADALAVIQAVIQKLVNCGQVEPVGAPRVLAALTAHHIIERLDYPKTTFQFEHQQFQEYYAALDIHARLLVLCEEDLEAKNRFMANYLNDPAWAEPLRIIAETFAKQTGDVETDKRNISAGVKLIKMALNVDPIFTGEIAQLCGSDVWDQIRATVDKRFRDIYAIQDDSYQRYALAAMLATGVADFKDILLPLLSSQDQQIRLSTYRLWPNFHLSSLGSNWREQVQSWSEEARADFVSELYHHQVVDEISNFAAEDNSIKVKKSAANSLLWIGSDDALIPILESMDDPTFVDITSINVDLIPTKLIPKTIAAMRKSIETTNDNLARLRTVLGLIELGETGLDGLVKDTLISFSPEEIRHISSHYIKSAISYLREKDPTWADEWLVTQIAEGILYRDHYQLPSAANISDDLIEKYLHRLEVENLRDNPFQGMITVVASLADEKISNRLFKKLRELRRKLETIPNRQKEFEWQVMLQLKDVFHRLPDDVAVAGILLSVTLGDPHDIKVASDLLNKNSYYDMEPLQIFDDGLKASLRDYLLNSIELVLRQDDFNGEEKANLATAIAQVGKPEDMEYLITLIHADIERMRRGRAAYMSGDRGPLGNGGRMTYAKRHISAVMNLDPSGAEQVLIDLLSEPEYRSDVAATMSHAFLRKPDHPFGQTLRHDLMWTVREKNTVMDDENQMRTKYAAALNSEINRLREQNDNENPATGLKELANALAAIDGRGSAKVVLEVISMPGQWDYYICLEAANRLFMAGVVLPTTTVFALVDSMLEHSKKWLSDSDRHLLLNILTLCSFVDDTSAGIDKIRNVLDMQLFNKHELCPLVTALGESRSDAAVDLLYELASDAQVFERCEDNFFNALTKLDTPRSRKMLLGFIDPDIQGIELPSNSRPQNKLIACLTELALRRPETATRLQELCELDLPVLHRQILSRIMASIGTPEALAANLNLIDDTSPTPVPKGIYIQLNNAFVERKPYEHYPNIVTLHARGSNEIRVQLFKLAIEDNKRQKTAFKLLGQIEEWRLEYGRPTNEPRHPDLESGQPWPLKGP